MKHIRLFFLLFNLSIYAQDTAILNHLPKCLDSLKTKNDSTTTIFFHVDKRYKINLVPVNSTTTIEKEKLENELNKIYYPYGVSVILNLLNKIEDKSWDLNNDGKLDVGETGILNFRTDEMKAVHRLNVNKNAEEIYLYLMQTPSKEGVEGDMPLGSQYGFLFGDPSARTLSHEIAHGYFQLKHSFDESIALQKSSTNNLMDYANGNTLYKYQWDLVHDKGLMIAKLWQSDSAGEAILVDNLIGAGIGALVEVSIQVATNVYEKYYEKKPNIEIFKIKWWPQVAIATGVGFVSSGASSMIKFTKFATSPIGKKALKIAIETSTDFLLGTISDVLIKYFENEPIEVKQAFINNLIGSSLFGTINNIVPLEKLKTALQNKFGKVKTILNEKIIYKQNNYIDNVYANTIVKIKNSKNKVVTKEEVRKKIIVKNKVIPDDIKIGELNLNKEIKEATNEEIVKIEKEATEEIVGETSKDVEEKIAKEVNELETMVGDKVVKGAGRVFKNIDLSTFKNTFTATEEQYIIAYKLWGEDKWDELYKYFKENDLNHWKGINWPPFNGAKSIIKTEKGNQLSGKVFDRFQNSEQLSGGFASPVLKSNEGVADLVFTYDSRALSDRIQDGTHYIKFKFKDNVPTNLEFEYGEAIPWFKLQGNADQVKSSIKFQDLNKSTYDIVEILKFDGGSKKWIKVK